MTSYSDVDSEEEEVFVYIEGIGLGCLSSFDELDRAGSLPRADPVTFISTSRAAVTMLTFASITKLVSDKH